MHDFLMWVVGGILIIVAVYLIVRVASTAYFKTRLDFLQRENKTTNKKG